MTPYLRVGIAPDEQAESERFTIQWNGVIYLKPGGAGSTDDSDRIDFNAGNTSAEEMRHHYPVVD